MKALVKTMLMAMIVIAMNGCAEETALTNEPLHFNFRVNTPANQPVESLDSETALIISMETPDGTPLYTLEKIAFTKDENGFTTSGMDLQPGDYVLTEFMLVNNNGDILYTIPYGDSPLNHSVKNPLGIGVQVAANRSGTIDAEALDVRNYTPADFGLTSFTTSNSFQVLIRDAATGKPIASSAVVLQGTDTVAQFRIPAKKSRIGFAGESDETYKLVISSGACAPLVEEFTLSEMSSEYKHKPYIISLDPAFTMHANAGADVESPFYFYLGGTEGSVTVDWGDGQSEAFSMENEPQFEVAHNYARAGKYPITITGDLDKITYFYSFYGGSIFNDINFKHLVNLNEIRYGLTHGPETLDLSHNTNLQFAMLPGMLSLKTLLLPETHKMIFLEIDGANLLDAEDVNAIIDNMYTNAVAGNLRDGVFGLRASWAQDENDMTMVGPPSAASMTKVEDLRDSYGWIIHPTKPDESLATDGRVRLRDLM
jgi:hypothetical protein